MPQFEYRAFSQHGTVTTGTIIAAGRGAAIEALYGDGLTPFETRQVKEAQRYSADTTGIQKSQRKSSSVISTKVAWLGLRGLSRFTVELSSLVSSGLPLDEAFRVIAASDPAGRIGRLASILLREILAGSQLSEAMAAFPGTFPVDYRAVVCAGEAAGAMGPALTQVAKLLSRRLEVRSKILTALVYPVVLVVMSVVSVGVIIGVLIPNLTPVFEDAGLPLPGVLSTFRTMEENSAVLALGTAFVLFGVWITKQLIERNPRARRVRDRMLCSVPVLGGLILLREAGAFSRALGTLICARASVVTSLQTATKLVSNAELSARYSNAAALIPQGRSMNQAFAGSGLIPPAGLSLIAVGEETGQLGTVLVQIASNLEGELHQRIERMVNLLTPILTLGIGAAVGGLILQVMTAVLSINNLAFQ